MTNTRISSCSRQQQTQKAIRSFNPIIQRGADSYDRDKHLQQLLPISASQISDKSNEAGKWIATRLAHALRAERNRGSAGHWAYSLNRHLALLQAYRGERMALDAFELKKAN